MNPANGWQARSQAINAFFFAVAIMGAGLSAWLVLSALWSGLNRDHLAGVAPAGNVFNFVLRHVESGRRASIEETRRVATHAFPGAEIVTIRRFSKEATTAGAGLGSLNVAMVSGDALGSLGVALQDGVGLAAGPTQVRQMLIGGSLRDRLPTLLGRQLAFKAVRSDSSRGNELHFDVVGELTAEFRGFASSQPIDLWVEEREWRDWLLPADVPAHFLEQLHPLSTTLLVMRQLVGVDDVVAGLAAASKNLNLPMAVSVVAGTAADPERSPRAHARAHEYALLAAATLVASILGGTFVWGVRLFARQHELRTRFMLGEPTTHSRRRLLLESARNLIAGLGAAILSSLIALRLLAEREPFLHFAQGAFFVPAEDWLWQVVWLLPLLLLMFGLQWLASELALKRFAQRRDLSGKDGLPSLLFISSASAVVGLCLALAALHSTRKEQLRDFGFDTSELMQVRLERSKDQLKDSVFDPRPAAPVLAALDARLSALAGVKSVAASSLHPLGKVSAREFRLPADPVERRRQAAVVAVAGPYFSTLGVAEPLAVSLQRRLPLRDNEVMVDATFSASSTVESGGAPPSQIQLLSFGPVGQPDPTMSIVARTPELFFDGATGGSVATIITGLHRSRDMHWLWLRADPGVVSVGDVQSLVKATLIESGVNVENVTVQWFDQALLAGMSGRIAERNTTVSASVILVVLSVGGGIALFVYTGMSRRRELAVRMAVGASPFTALLGTVRRGMHWQAMGGVVGMLAAFGVLTSSMQVDRVTHRELIVIVLLSTLTMTLVWLLGLALVARRVARSSLRGVLAEG